MADLEREMATYARLLMSLQDKNGKFVVIKDADMIGTYDSYADALRFGYERFGLKPFLVKQITPGENVYQFTRDLAVECR